MLRSASSFPVAPMRLVWPPAVLRTRFNALACAGELRFAVEGQDDAMLRKLPKEQRKNKILDSVEDLIRSTSSIDFTMHQLAIHVGISPTTFYNLFGSKGTVLYSMLNRALDKIISGREAIAPNNDPVDYAIYTMTYAAELFVEKTSLYRPLYKFQLGERDMAARPFYLDRALDFWRRSLAGLVECGYLSDDPADGAFSRDAVALALLTHSNGVIDLWVQEDINDDEFLARMTHDAALIVHGTVPASEQKKIKQLIKSLQPRIKNFSFLRD